MFGLLCVFDVAAEISTESNFYEDEGTDFLVDGGLVQVEDSRDASDVYKVWRSTVTHLEERLGLFYR